MPHARDWYATNPTGRTGRGLGGRRSEDKKQSDIAYICTHRNVWIHRSIASVRAAHETSSGVGLRRCPLQMCIPVYFPRRFSRRGPKLVSEILRKSLRGILSTPHWSTLTVPKARPNFEEMRPVTDHTTRAEQERLYTKRRQDVFV